MILIFIPGVWSVHHYISKVHKKTSGWLNCVETKAGIPYTTLVVILFMSLLMMAWICCSSCVEEEDDDEVHDKKVTIVVSHIKTM